MALQRAGVDVENYFASEIDKYAMRITEKNFPHPEVIQLGDVNNWESWKLPHIDLLIGGSPCPGFSVAGHGQNFDDPRSRLFFKYVDILNYYKYLSILNCCKPTFFLLENVRMKKEWQNTITFEVGVEPIEIDSALVSAQTRKRLYWTNIPNVTQPEDRGILLRDVIESGEVDREKSYCIDACYYKGGSEKTLKRLYFDKSRRQIVKASLLHESERRLMVQDEEHFRMLTPLECERLQTYPDNYTEGVSRTQRYKMLGNSWTVDVIAHIFKELK